MDQIDLLLPHQPLTAAFGRTIGACEALEKLLADQKVRAIGVSNFMPDVLERLLAETEIVPAVNQVEVHPHFFQPDVQKADAEHGILTQAWSPMGEITSCVRLVADDDGPGSDGPRGDQAIAHIGIVLDEALDHRTMIGPPDEDRSIRRFGNCACEDQVSASIGFPSKRQVCLPKERATSEVVIDQRVFE